MNRQQRRLRERYGPWAVITGASSGIGEQIARQLAAAGLDLVLVARHQHRLTVLAEELRVRNAVIVDVLALDLVTDDGVRALLGQTAGRDVGLYVAAAGFGTSGPLLDADPSVEHDMLTLNCRTVLATTIAYANRMRARGRGGIILLSSLLAGQGTPLAAHYAATKAYVHTLGEALAVELRPHGIDVLTTAPGPTHSGFAARADITMTLAATAHSVATGTLAALGRRPVTRPAALTRLLTYSLAPVPRRLRVRIMGIIMTSMTTRPQPTSPS